MSEKNEPIICIVCFEHEDKDLVILKCHQHHIVCTDCIIKLHKKECPLCKTNISESLTNQLKLTNGKYHICEF